MSLETRTSSGVYFCLRQGISERSYFNDKPCCKRYDL